MRVTVHLLVLIGLLSTELRATERAVLYECRGLEAYEIKGTHEVDWAWGNIREKHGSVTLGFSVGPMVEELVPRERPAGYRWFKVERVGNVTFRYGYHVWQKQLRATIIGAPLNSRVNLVGRPDDKTGFLAIARALITAPCKATFSDKPVRQ